VFDFADSSTVVGRRNISTVAPQALFLMNHPFITEQAELAAKRLPAGSDFERIAYAYLITLGRKPTEGESSVVRKHLSGGWPCVFQAIFASMDFRYLN